MKTIIMAGGKGTRMASIAEDIPKPMIPICSRPILEYQIECLAENGLTDITIVIGHLGDIIKNHFKDGSDFGCNISYYTETAPLGTAGALFKLNLAEDFILINGDIIFNVDFSRMIDFHKEKKALATLAVHPNSHPYDSALIISNGIGQVTGWMNKEEPRLYYKNMVNAGIHILSPDILKNCTNANEKIDLDRDILKPSIPSNRIFAYSTPEYIKDMGTPERYAQVSADIEKNIVNQKCLSNRQKCVFLDRDGTINRLNGFISSPDDFELLEGAAAAIKQINNMGYLSIVVTNQPVIARGETDFETLELIHQKMETELGKHGAYIDDLFFCPHHPDKGFPGERPELKRDCDCRKPKPGMIFQAAEKYNIDLSKSYMVGDDMRDVNAGLNSGCMSVLITSKKSDANEIGYKIFASLNSFTDYLSTNH